MKKRVMAWLLVLLLLCTLTLPVSSEEPLANIFFVAYNDTLPLTLPLNQWIYNSGNETMVSHNVFSVSGLEISLSVDEESNMLRLYNRSKWLKFEPERGIVTEEDGTERNIPCEVRNNAIFVPLDYCVKYFGLQYSYLTSIDGYRVLRLKNGQQSYSDTRFIDRAENLIEIHVQNYLLSQQEKAPAEDPAPSTAPQERPLTGHCTAYLAVVGIEHAEQALSVLSRRSTAATFFLTAEEIAENPALVREIAATGYPIGLTVEEEEEHVSESLSAANRALDAVLHQKTLLALLTKEQGSEAPGYCGINRDLAVSVYAAIATDTHCLILCGENTYQNTLLLSGAGANIRFLRETSPF